MTAMIICSLFNFGCSKKANITVEGGSTTTESVKIGDSIILKCDSPEHFGFWIANLNKSTASDQVTIELNDTVKINLTINKTTDISKSYKSAE